MSSVRMLDSGTTAVLYLPGYSSEYFYSFDADSRKHFQTVVFEPAEDEYCSNLVVLPTEFKVVQLRAPQIKLTL